MENIPYFDFSVFPFKSEVVINKIKFAADKGFRVIFINFGSFFPWSIENIIRSKNAYTDKLIEKIVNICNENEIILIPALSILTNSDFILKDKKYKYLISNSLEHKGLDVSACGAGKLVENMIDDIYSLMSFSNYLLIELPDFNTNKISDKNNILTNHFIKRITDNLNNIDKKLILGCLNKCNNYHKQFISEDIKFIFKKNIKKYSINTNISYNLDIIKSKININGIEYILFHLNGTDGFAAGLDSATFINNYDKGTQKAIVNYKINETEKFYSLLDENWSLIRLCWDNLSYVYRNTDPVYRITFIRSVKILSNNFEKLKKSSIRTIDIFEEVYQPGIIREWVNLKLDSVLNQLKNLENLSLFMHEGN